MSLAKLHPTLTAPKRLAIAAVLVNSASASFTFLRSHLDLSESDLSKQLAAMHQDGLIKVRKSGRGPGARTDCSITRQGKAAFTAHVAALHELLNATAESATGPATAGPPPLARSARG